MVGLIERKFSRKKEFFLFLFTIFFLFGYILIFLIIPFALKNNLTSWDTAGLYFSAFYQKEYLFPKVIGWNPYFFLGYPQHAFYPPLYAYLTSILSFVFPLSFSFKLLFAFFVLLLPISFYFFVRSFGLSRLKSGVAMLLMSSFLFLFPKDFYGGNMHATFEIGLIAHVQGMALFFFYWGLIERRKNTTCEKKEKIYALFSALVLSAIVLSHILGAFASALLIFSYFLISLSNLKENKRFIGFLFLHSFWAFLLVSFWAIPFLVKIRFSSSYPIGDIPFATILFLISVVFLIFLFLKRKFSVLPLVTFILFGLFFCLIGRILQIPIHFYRLTLFFLVLLPVMFLVFLEKDDFFVLSLFTLLGVFLILTSTPINVKGPENVSFLPLKENLSGERIFVFAPYHKEPSPHALQHLVPLTYNIYGVRGLYVESARHARYVFDLENQLEPGDSIVWGNYLDRGLISDDPHVIEKILPYQFSVLGVNYIVAPRNYSFLWEEIQDIAEVPGIREKQNYSESTNYTYKLYKVGNSSLIEVLNYTPRFVKTNWEEESVSWFLSDSIKQGVLTDEQTPNLFGRGNEKIEIKEISRRQDYLRFRVLNASNPVPILIKISFFPNWKAYEATNDGKKEIKIYRASPEIMLIYASGEVEMKYEKIFCDKIGEVLSLIGFLAIVFFVVAIIREKLNIGNSFLKNGV